MRILDRLRRLLRDLFDRSRWEREAEEELRTFVAMSAVDRHARGVPGAEALRAAKLEAGGIEQAKERLRDDRWGAGLDALWRDVRHGARLIRRQPGFSAVVVATLALGIGANTAVFSVVKSVLLAPLPFAESEQVVRLLIARGHGGEGSLAAAPPPVYFHAMRERSRLLERVAAQRYQNLTLSGDGEPERIVGIGVSDQWLETLGVRPVIGRGFDATEQAAGSASNVVLLSHAFWQRRYGGDRSVIGRVLRLNQRSYTVIGVMPASFRYPYQADLWLPMTFPAGASSPADLNVPARLRPGGTVAQLRVEMDGLARQLAAELQGFDDVVIVVRPFAEEFRRDPNRSIAALLAAVGFVLLIACANVANLMLARSGARAGEIAVRSALGAGRARQLRQLLTESVMLAGLGGVFGAALAIVATRWLGVLIPSRLGEVVSSVRLDGSVLVACAVLCILTGIVFGLPPALRLTRRDAMSGLRERGTAHGRSGRLLEALVVVEVAIATLLLTGAGLVGRNFSSLLNSDVGYETDGLLRINLSLSDPSYADPERRVLTVGQVLDNVRAVPGVVAAGITTLQPIPRTTANTGTSFVTDANADVLDLPPVVNLRMVSADYFLAMGMSVLAGRGLADADDASGVPVLVVNQTAARRFWPDGDAVGRRVKPGNVADTSVAWHDVVGVVSDIAEPYDQIPETIYLAYPQATASQAAGTWTTTSVSMLVRIAGETGSALDAIRAVIHEVDPALPLFNVSSMGDALAEPLSDARLGAIVLAGFGSFGLFMAILGTYGVLAFSVNRRTPEFGMRMALGAAPASILAMVIRRGLVLVAAGLTVGAAATLALARPLAGLVSEVSPRDPIVLGITAITLLLAGTVACWIPAWRATRVDPVSALRAE